MDRRARARLGLCTAAEQHGMARPALWPARCRGMATKLIQLEEEKLQKLQLKYSKL
jgi:hypothetical protein